MLCQPGRLTEAIQTTALGGLCGSKAPATSITRTSLK